MLIAQTRLWASVLSLIISLYGVSPLMLPEDSLLKKLDQLAAAGNSQQNIDAFSDAIVKLGGVDKLHEPFGSTLTKRLAADELRVRTGKQARVSELDVSMAFNRIAEIVGAQPRANVDTVHAFRKILEPYAPNLITLGAFPDSCNPGEALFLVYIMIANDGTLHEAHQDEQQALQPESVRGGVRILQRPPGMKILVSKFVREKQDVELLRRLDNVLALLRL